MKETSSDEYRLQFIDSYDSPMIFFSDPQILYNIKTRNMVE